MWAAMVERCMTAFAEADPERVVIVRYEELTRDPARLLATICSFLGEHESGRCAGSAEGLAGLDRPPQGA